MASRLAYALRSPRSVVLRSAGASLRPLVRSLHTTYPRLASEAPQSPVDPMSDPKFQDFFEKIRGHQGAVDAMMKVGELMKSKGLDTTKPPSKMEMIKLSMDKDLRDAATNLVTQLKEAGVELDAQTMQDMFSKMK